MLRYLQLLYTRVCYCNTHYRFKKAFDRLESTGFNLFMRFGAESSSAQYQAEFRRYSKNLRKLNSLYNRFSGKA